MSEYQGLFIELIKIGMQGYALMWAAQLNNLYNTRWFIMVVLVMH